MAPTQEKDVRTNLVMPTLDHLGRWNQFALKRTEKWSYWFQSGRKKHEENIVHPDFFGIAVFFLAVFGRLLPPGTQ